MSPAKREEYELEHFLEVTHSTAHIERAHWMILHGAPQDLYLAEIARIGNDLKTSAINRLFWEPDA